MRAAHGIGAIAILVVTLVAVRGHPAEEAVGGGALAGAAGASLRGWARLSVMDPGAPAAYAILVASTVLAGTVGTVLLAPRADHPADDPGPVPGAALLGHAAGTVAALLGGGGPALYAVGGGAAALLLLSRGVPSPGRPLAAGRAAGVALLGALLWFASYAGDGLLHGLTGETPLPEAWFVAASEAGAGWTGAGALLALAGTAAAAVGMECRGGGCGLAASAASWTLLLGPSNPCRGLALAFGLRALAACGLPGPVRAAYAFLVVLGMAILVHAI